MSIEEAAKAVWRAEFGLEPNEPLRTEGGALDPDAWCMAVATAVAKGTDLPLKYKDQPMRPDDPVATAARAALAAEAPPASS